MQVRFPAIFLAAVFGALFLFDDGSLAQRSRDRVTAPVDNRRTVKLTGNRHPLARREFETGAAAGTHRMERMILVLQPDASQRTALDALLEAQHDPNSPQYQKWLTPESFGERFGASPNDVAQVVRWLNAHGLEVEEISAGRQSIVFSGTAAQVESAFSTRIHSYDVDGEPHYGNASDPEIPEALASVVAGVVSLHDFRRQPMHARLQSAPEYTSGASHYLAPADFAAIYDVAPLYLSGIDGTGQTIAIVGRTNLNPSDVQTFRNTFALAANTPTIVLNGPNPGIVSFNEQVEASLDVQWSGAVAPKAAVKFVVSASTSASDGVDLSTLYIVSHNLAPVMSTSFGSCETAMGATERSFYNNLWQQAAAQGITTLVSSGDSGAAGCDGSSAAAATHGAAVNGLCSTPYNVCVGGTQFNEAGNPGLYWSAASLSPTYASALSYIPEVVWNESGSNGGSGLWAGGGGASAYYAKPSWQIGPGVPADGRRDVPDVSLAAGGHDGYLVAVNGSFYVVSGTSAASPAFAGLMALVDQRMAARQGNANTKLYLLANAQASGGAACFHDITSGNNAVPGLTGFNAGARYDLATGLGSADAFVLVNHWGASLQGTPALALTVTPATITIPRGSSSQATASVAVSGGLNSSVVLSVTGAPAGVTAAFAPGSFSAPGSGTSALTLTVGASTAAGTYPLTIAATGGGVVRAITLTLIVPSPSGFTLSVAPNRLILARGGSGSAQVAVKPVNGFNSTVGLSAGPLPAGVAVQFAPPSIAGSGGVTTMTVQTTTAAPRGNYLLVVTGTSAGVTPSPAVAFILTLL